MAPAAVPLTSGDRPYYTAPAISANGTDVYITYNAFITPFRNDTSSPRGLVARSGHRGEPGQKLTNSDNGLPDSSAGATRRGPPRTRAAGVRQLILVGRRNASWRRWSSWPVNALKGPSL
jgi:hypothetical protein